MPPQFIPKNSGVHRASCFALYRALLRRTNRLILTEQERFNLESRLKNGFRKNVKTQSPSDIVAALHRGYGALKILYMDFKRSSTVSNQLSTPTVDSSTERPYLMPTISPERRDQIAKTTRPPRTGPRVWPLANGYSILARPFKTVSGRRRVPHFVQAHGFPFLRCRKPQSPYLSRLIRDHVSTKIKHNDMWWMLRFNSQFAREEDRWDQVLELTCGISPPHGESSWTTEASKALRDIWSLFQRRRQTRLRMAKRLQGIVTEEQTLAKEEAKGRAKKELKSTLSD